MDLEYQICSQKELQTKEWLPVLLDVINDAFKHHGLKDFFDSKIELSRHESTQDYIDNLSPEGIICVYFAKDQNTGEKYPVATAGIKPYEDKKPTAEGLEVLGHRLLVPEKTFGDVNWEVCSVAVWYNDNRFLKRGLVGKCIENLMDHLSTRLPADAKSLMLWVRIVDVNCDYWQRRGYSLVEEYSIAKGGWNSIRDFTLYNLNRLIDLTSGGKIIGSL